MKSTNFNRTTTAQEVVNAFPESIEGKYIVITGVSLGGIGYETARAILTKSPKLLVLTGRDQAKLDKALANLLAENPSGNSKTIILDLASLSSVRSGAQEILKLGNPNILINNAAVMMCPYSTTPEGFELQFGTNFIGPYVLTNLLLPGLLKTEKPRVVNVSSMAHIWAPVNWDDPGFSKGEKYNKTVAYGQSKSALNLFTVGLAERYGKDGLIAISLHPGGIATDLQRHLTLDEKKYYKEAYNAFNDDWTPNMDSGIWKTLEQGASTTLVAALDPAMEEINGSYLADCQPATLLKGETGMIESAGCVAPFSIDKELAHKLWGWTNNLIGGSF